MPGPSDDYILDHMISTVTELKAHLSESLRRVRAGETLVVTERRKAIVRILPYETDSLIDQVAITKFLPIAPELVNYKPLDSRALLAAERGDH